MKITRTPPCMTTAIFNTDIHTDGSVDIKKSSNLVFYQTALVWFSVSKIQVLVIMELYHYRGANLNSDRDIVYDCLISEALSEIPSISKWLSGLEYQQPQLCKRFNLHLTGGTAAALYVDMRQKITFSCVHRKTNCRSFGVVGELANTLKRVPFYTSSISLWKGPKKRRKNLQTLNR